MIEHFIEHGMRENYRYEKMKAEGAKDKDRPTTPAMPPAWGKHFGRGGLAAE